MSSKQSPIIPGTVGIHVLSDQRGESIIVTLPNGKWFVVDAFQGSRAGKNRPHSVLTFLNRFGLRTEDCVFVLLTHLHDDHYAGIPSLLTELRKTCSDLKFARHAAYRESAVIAELEQALVWREHHAPLVERQCRVGARVRQVVQLCLEDCIDVSQWFYRDFDDCQVVVVMPGESIVNSHYAGKVLPRIPPDIRSTDDERAEEIIGRQDTIINDMSVGLYIVFGSACIMLTGDCEQEAWSCLAAHSTAKDLEDLGDVLTRITFMKSPHHASSRAWNETLERCYDQCDLAIATHHRRGGYVLPDRDGILKILERDVLLAVPNRQWLPREISSEHDRSLPSLVRVPVSRGTRGDRPKADALGRRYAANVRPEPDDEVCWVSISFDRSGRSGRCFGGSHAAILGAKP